MVTETELKDAIYQQLVDFMNRHTDVSKPSDHAALLDNTSSVVYPFLGFRLFNQPKRQGMGAGGSRVTSVTRDDSGNVTQITRARTYAPRVEFSLLTDDTRQRSILSDEFRGLLALWNQNTAQLHADVQRVQGASSSQINRPNERRVRGRQFNTTIDYDRFTTTDVAAVTDIDIVLKEAESGATVREQS